jgi:hypothetical protein
MFQTKVVEKIKTPILCPVIFLPKIVLFDIMWKNMVGPKGPEITIYYSTERMWFACQRTKAQLQTQTLNI